MREQKLALEFVETDRSGDIGIIVIQNPPVNAMSPGVPRDIMTAVDAFNADQSVNALVLMGGGKGNIAGADIRFQGTTLPGNEPTLRDLIEVLEASTKPVIAALGPNTLGGGLELAMACVYRVISATGKVGQPEVNLGIPPGAGGTQRLPRLAGIKKALDMIVSGKPIIAQEALHFNIVDRVIEDDLCTGAVAFANEIRNNQSHERTRDKRCKPVAPDFFDDARQTASKKYRQMEAPLVCIDCVEAALTMPFEQGIQFERDQFSRCVISDQAAALRHVFFAGRKAGKPENIGADIKPAAVNNIAVIGAGTMGSGISIALLKAGYRVNLIESSAAALDHGKMRIHSALERDVARGRISGADLATLSTALTGDQSIDAVGGADMVIEAVFEDMEVKTRVFQSLGEIAPSAVLATNTSYLNLNLIAEAAGEAKGQVVGMHFFSPANIMQLLEVVRGQYTSEQTLLTALDVGKRAGKTTIIAGVCQGFIANRLYGCYLREANFLLEEGALPAQVDKVLTDFGFAMGPFAVSDLAGLDIGWANRKSQAARRDPALRYPVIADKICERGWFGQKTGRGFYRYPEGDRRGETDPEVTELILQASRELDIRRRDISCEEILKRCLYAVINEGANILAEGIAEKPGDIDIGWIYGYGFPRWRGGPLFFADQTGLPQVLDDIHQFHHQHDFWQPAERLGRMVVDKKGFY